MEIDVGLKTSIVYLNTIFPNHKESADLHFDMLSRLDWVRHGVTPRSEYYVNKMARPYTYGTEPYARTYEPQAWKPGLEALLAVAEEVAQEKFEVCFLNYYLTGKDQLGWHSDDSPEMDDARPIVIMTFGAEREIWFRPRPELVPLAEPVTKLKLGHGSICIMPAGMQDTHQHRIPKASNQNSGPRISLTFRGLA